MACAVYEKTGHMEMMNQTEKKQKLILPYFFLIFLGIALNILMLKYPMNHLMGYYHIHGTLTAQKQVGVTIASQKDTLDVSVLSSIQYTSPLRPKNIKLRVRNDAEKLYLTIAGEEGTNVSIHNVYLQYKEKKIFLLGENDGCGFVMGDKPFETVLDISKNNFNIPVTEHLISYTWIKKVILCIVLDLLLLVLLFHLEKVIFQIRNVWESKKLILSLAKSDFKVRFADSYFGILWAFIQPAISVIVYWFVFQIALGSQPVSNVPYILWLISGLVPWFYFEEALGSGTGALLQYSFLVKKVVFKIEILPIIKVLSALFVHIFLVAFVLFLYILMGHFPGTTALQVFYYSFAMFMLNVGLAYFTSAFNVFFRDLSQIIMIVIQIGVWLTPIMWNMDSMDVPEGLAIFFKLNPMYYITNGYRLALIHKIWFWEDIYQLFFFWMVVFTLIGAGYFTFEKLKIHYADSL